MKVVNIGGDKLSYLPSDIPPVIDHISSKRQNSDLSSMSCSITNHLENVRSGSVKPEQKKMTFHPASGSAIREKLDDFIIEKKSAIFEHNKNICLLKILKDEKKIATIEQAKFEVSYMEEKDKLIAIRKKRNRAERIFDRQETINNLGSKSGLITKARLLFIKKLDHFDHALLEARGAINQDIGLTEDVTAAKNKVIIKNALLIASKRNDIELLQKTIKATAVDLYAEITRIEKRNNRLTVNDPAGFPLEIKNGKYLLIPLLKKGEFRSFGAQLAYQAKRLTVGIDESGTPASEVRMFQSRIYCRVEI